LGVEIYPLHWLQAEALTLGLGPTVVLASRWAGLGALALLLAVLVLWPRGRVDVRRAVVHALLAGGVAYLLAVLLSSSFPISRPPAASGGLVRALVPMPASSAFPARLGAFLFGAAAGLWGAGEDWVVLGFLYAALAALSQMLAGLYFPSDEVGGLILGISSAVAVLLAQGIFSAPVEALLHLGGWKASRPPRRGVR
jgi:hypothetical protein